MVSFVRFFQTCTLCRELQQQRLQTFWWMWHICLRGILILWASPTNKCRCRGFKCQNKSFIFWRIMWKFVQTFSVLCSRQLIGFGFLSHRDSYVVVSLEAVAYSSYCNTVEWFWWDWSLSQWPTGFLQYIDTVGRVIWPIKIVPEMTYKVSSGTLRPSLLISILWAKLQVLWTQYWYVSTNP